jgi:hypothetical protein
MPYYAKTKCPACGSGFQTPVDQIIDVRVDPEAKRRMLSGAVNVARCPACGWAGRLNTPFIYHDPAQEVALLYLPVEAGRNEAERQKAAGRLTRRLSNSLPPEERKGYLLNPETFITMESMVNRVLELEGVTEEDMARSAAQQQLLQDLLKAEQDAWEEMVEEKTDLIDEGFFYLLNYNMRMFEAVREQQEKLPPDAEEMADKVEALQDYLTETHALGRKLAARSKAIRPFMENPNREALVDALVAAPDDGTVEMLVQTGAQLMDYGFFQQLVQRIEAAESDEERDRLKALRRHVLDLRDELQESSQALLGERTELLQKLLKTEEPLKMARSHLSELDEAFSYVLQSHIRFAQRTGDESQLSNLQELTEVLDQLMEQSMPPEVALTRRLLMVPSDEAAVELLAENRGVVTESFVEFLTALEERTREDGDVELADRLGELHQLAQRFVTPLAKPTAGESEEPPRPSEPLGPGEKRGPGGLIISGKK